MKKAQYILITLLLAVMFGCELVVDVDLPEFKPSLVVNSLLSPDDTVITVFVTENRHILDNAYDFKTVKNAKVEVFEDQQSIGVLTYSDGDRPGYYLEYKPKAGKTYRLDVSKDGFTKVSATTTIPLKEPIFYFESASMRKDEYGSEEIRLDYILEDPKGDDYYWIKLYANYSYYNSYYDEEKDSLITEKYTDWQEWYYYLLGADLNEFEDYSLYEYTTDELFDGSNKKFSIEFPDIYSYDSEDSKSDTSQFRLEIHRMTEAFYRYTTTSEIQYYNGDSPFSEPVKVYSNIENGFGVLGSQIIGRKEFEIANGKLID